MVFENGSYSDWKYVRRSRPAIFRGDFRFGITVKLKPNSPGRTDDLRWAFFLVSLPSRNFPGGSKTSVPESCPGPGLREQTTKMSVRIFEIRLPFWLKVMV